MKRILLSLFVIIGFSTYASAQSKDSKKETPVKKVGKTGKKVGKTVGKTGAEVGKDAGKTGAKVGKDIGKTGATVGKDIGKFGARTGKAIAKPFKKSKKESSQK